MWTAKKNGVAVLDCFIETFGKEVRAMELNAAPRYSLLCADALPLLMRDDGEAVGHRFRKRLESGLGDGITGGDELDAHDLLDARALKKSLQCDLPAAGPKLQYKTSAACAAVDAGQGTAELARLEYLGDSVWQELAIKE